MKIFLPFLLLSFSSLSFADSFPSASCLQGITSFTVYNQISPHPLYVSFSSALTEELKQMGSIVNMNSQEALNENFFSAISGPVFLKLSIENWIVEIPSTVGVDGQLKVEVHLILQAMKRFSKDENEEKGPATVWVVDEVIDFSSDQARLLKDATDAIKKMSKFFFESYRAANPQSENNPTFFLL